MANLIKRIAISTSKRTGKHSIAQEFKSSTDHFSSTGPRTTTDQIHELASIVSFRADGANERGSFAPTGKQIKATKEVTVTSEPNPYYERNRRGSEVEITGAWRGARKACGADVDVVVEERARSGSEGEVDSLKSEGVGVGIGIGEGGKNDDEVVLVGRGRARR